MHESWLIEVVLHVADVDAAAAFLEKTAGLPVLERRPDFTVLDAGGVRLALRPARLLATGHDGAALGDAPAPPAELILGSADVAAAHAAALAAGATSLTPPASLAHGRVATVAVPGGLRVSYYARLSRPAPHEPGSSRVA